MDLEAAAGRFGPRSLLVRVGWFALAVVLVTVWGVAAMLFMAPGGPIPFYGPEEAPAWVAYSGLVFTQFVAPLLLLLLTQRLRTLNRMLMGLYLVNAVLFAAGLSSLVLFARTLDAPLERIAGAALTVLAVVLHGRANKRIQADGAPLVVE